MMSVPYVVRHKILIADLRFSRVGNVDLSWHDGIVSITLCCRFGYGVLIEGRVLRSVIYGRFAVLMFFCFSVQIKMKMIWRQKLRF